MERTLENTAEAILNHLAIAKIVETPFGLEAQGVTFCSEHGRFQVRVTDNGDYRIRVMNTGKYETGMKSPLMNIDHIAIWLEQHNAISNTGKLN